MRQEMQDVLVKNILPFWQTKMIDRENGGFYGRIDSQEVLHADAEKGAILNARILWTFLKAIWRRPPMPRTTSSVISSTRSMAVSIGVSTIRDNR